MTRPTHAPIHVVPVDARGDHRPLSSCPCRPILAVDLLDGAQGTTFWVHRHAPEVPDAKDKPRLPLIEWA
jgi:hypothetical protein